MPIKTPKILPGEKGYISKKEKTATKKAKEKKTKAKQRKKEMTIGKIKTGTKGYRIGRQTITPKKERKYPSYCCQKCGKTIGWLGRFVEWFYCGIIKHNCKPIKL